jgi:Pentapeptide repeats (9 copies)
MLRNYATGAGITGAGMLRDETVALFLEGREAWNAWAEDMLAARRVLEADGRWAAKRNSSGHLEPQNAQTDGWMRAAAAIFSFCVFLVAGDRRSGAGNGDNGYKPALPAGKVVQLDTGGIDFGGFVFPGDVWFDNAAFSGDTSFTSAAFLGGARFDSATFLGNAWFNGAIFSGYARFSGAAYTGNVWFDSAAFAGGARFDSVVFSGNALFGSTVFANNAGFSDAKFLGYASFASSVFSDNARFCEASFSGGAWFSNAAFKKRADFELARFTKKAVFDGLEAQHTFNLTDTAFAQVPLFSQAEFGQPPNLSGMSFPLPAFWDAGKAEFVAPYRLLRRMAAQSGDYEREHMALKGELRSRRWSLDKWWHPGLWLGLFYDGASDCGRSVARAFIAWLALLAIFPLLYLLNSPIPLGAWQSPCPNSQAHAWERAANLALSNSVPVVFNARSEDTRAFLACTAPAATPGRPPQLDSPLSLTALQLLQALLSATLIFLVLLAVKNRFKIK